MREIRRKAGSVLLILAAMNAPNASQHGPNNTFADASLVQDMPGARQAVRRYGAGVCGCTLSVAAHV